MNTVRSAPVRTSKRVVLVSVISTAAVCVLGTVAYTRLVPASRAGDCSCAQAEVSAGAVPRTAGNESLVLALAAIASAKTLEQQPPVNEPRPRTPDAAPSRGSDEPPMSKDEIAARQKADAYALDAQILSEEVDPIWAPKVERATAEAITRVGSSVHLEEVTCRETLCRAKVTHLDPNAHEADLDRLLTMPVIAGQALAFAPSNDDRNTVLYFSRKGTFLSVLQPPMQMTLPASMAPSDVPPSGE